MWKEVRRGWGLEVGWDTHMTDSMGGLAAVAPCYPALAIPLAMPKLYPAPSHTAHLRRRATLLPPLKAAGRGLSDGLLVEEGGGPPRLLGHVGYVRVCEGM